MALYAQVEQAKHKIDCGQLSIARVLQAFRRIMRDYKHGIQRHGSLSSMLRRALKDNYVRQNKSSRDYPRKKPPDPPAGPPEVLDATRDQIRRAKQILTTA